MEINRIKWIWLTFSFKTITNKIRKFGGKHSHNTRCQLSVPSAFLSRQQIKSNKWIEERMNVLDFINSRGSSMRHTCHGSSTSIRNGTCECGWMWAHTFMPKWTCYFIWERNFCECECKSESSVSMHTEWRNMKHFSKLTLKQTGKVYFKSTKYVFRLGKMSNDASLRNRMVLQGRCIVFLGCVFGCFCSITIKLWHT